MTTAGEIGREPERWPTKHPPKRAQVRKHGGRNIYLDLCADGFCESWTCWCKDQMYDPAREVRGAK